ncbi:LysM peptidoglycan-binding domain-containing protein [Psychrobacillus vulpis]|uniref:LysM peptidoglycan-binding domain-containing protein n=2 Tax=Psychrobacillus vulpis TaxID=2325572 RepID=A0A544TWK9_9BACI|nr:LysM peptidoglycan-binding domain-containing protein [Psychrobacillus vulpis]
MLSSTMEGEDLSNPPNYLEDLERTLEHSKESDILFQYALDMGLVTYPPLELPTEPETYTVVEGDNLYRIALKHDISLDNLMMWNNLTGSLIHPDDVLIVSGNEEGSQSIDSEQDTMVAVSSPISAPPPVEDSKEMLVTATAYTAYCEGCSGTTAYGIDLRSNPNQKVIAVDPRIIPLGTKVWVEGYGEAIAGDTGGAIKGHKIDVFIPSYNNAMEWGVKKVKIRVLN